MRFFDQLAVTPPGAQPSAVRPLINRQRRRRLDQFWSTDGTLCRQYLGAKDSEDEMRAKESCV